jgi:hypothetical protein
MFVFALLDSAVLLLVKRPLHQLDKEKRRIIIGLTAVILVINLPLFVKYIPNGHDLQFHLLRIYSIATGLSNGIFPVRIMAPWANGYGYATGVCYGDILLYFPAILYDLGFPLMWAYKSMVFLTNAAVALVSYYCFSRMGDNRNIGLTGSAVYTLGLWHVIDTYTRAAVGEADAFIFVPLVFLGLWNLAGYEKKQSKKQVETILCLTLGFSGLLQVHLLSLIMTAVFALILILTAWRKNTAQGKSSGSHQERSVYNSAESGFPDSFSGLLPYVSHADQYRSYEKHPVSGRNFCRTVSHGISDNRAGQRRIEHYRKPSFYTGAHGTCHTWNCCNRLYSGLVGKIR